MERQRESLLGAEESFSQRIAAEPHSAKPCLCVYDSQSHFSGVLWDEVRPNAIVMSSE